MPTSDRSDQAGLALDAAGARDPFPSVARAVTLFEDRAEVVRVARIPGAAGTRWVAIGGVSVFIDERTVRARVLGAADAAGSGDSDGKARADAKAEVTAVRVRWRAHSEAALGREEIEALEREAREATARLAAAERAQDRASRRETQATQLLSKWAEAISAVPRGAAPEGEAPPGAGSLSAQSGAASWALSLRSLDGAASAALSASAEARVARARAEDDAGRAGLRLSEGAREQPRYEAVVEVEVRAEDARPIDVELTYRVACALWRPEHLARLSGTPESGGRAEVELITSATAWQATGEVWDGVTARFSTARPSRAASPPHIEDDVLRMRRKTSIERSQVVVEAREQAIAAAGLSRGARAVDEMPGVDDGGEPLVFEAEGPVTLASDGRPFRVAVSRRVLEAEIALVLYPEVHSAAHVRATMTLADDAAGGGGPRPLLAGPVRIARGKGLVGRSKIDFVGAGEPFEIGFGVDDAVRVRRMVEEKTDTTAITGTRKIRRLVKIYLSNQSGDAKRLVVTERIPVSEVAEVEVTLGEAPGFSLDAKDGFLRGHVELPANRTRTLTFSYEIKAASNVVLPI